MFRTLAALCLSTLVFGSFVDRASAQSLNVDLFGNSPATVPSDAYGAAAGQGGRWNALNCSFCEPQQFPLLDLTGAPTSARLDMLQGGFGESCTDASLTGDEAALLRSGQAGFDAFTAVRFNISGLQAGQYDLYLYAGKRCTNIAAPVTCDLTIGPSRQLQHATGVATSTPFELDGNCMRFRFELKASQVLGFNLVAGTPEWFSAYGLQLVKLSPRILSTCFGANDEFGCPCGPGAFGNGCPSSYDPSGAQLQGSGVASVTADSLVLSATGVANSPVLFFQGTILSAQGAGTKFGDGLLCAGGAFLRLAILTPENGASAYPPLGDTPLSLRGFIPPAGGQRVYQVIYRDLAPYCTSDAFNLTNAVLVTWAP